MKALLLEANQPHVLEIVRDGKVRIHPILSRGLQWAARAGTVALFGFIYLGK
jgi:hypothetical protein